MKKSYHQFEPICWVASSQANEGTREDLSAQPFLIVDIHLLGIFVQDQIVIDNKLIEAATKW